jgi:hypothetical protein
METNHKTPTVLGHRGRVVQLHNKPKAAVHPGQ